MARIVAAMAMTHSPGLTGWFTRAPEAYQQLALGATAELRRRLEAAREPAGESGRMGHRHRRDDPRHRLGPLPSRLQRHCLRRLLREGAPVALERGARVLVLGGAEEEAQDLGDVILVDTEVHEPLGVLIPDRLVLRAAQTELLRDPGEVGEPARPKRRVAPDVEHHLVGRQRRVAALDVTHRTTASGASGSP